MELTARAEQAESLVSDPIKLIASAQQSAQDAATTAKAAVADVISLTTEVRAELRELQALRKELKERRDTPGLPRQTLRRRAGLRLLKWRSCPLRGACGSSRARPPRLCVSSWLG